MDKDGFEIVAKKHNRRKRSDKKCFLKITNCNKISTSLLVGDNEIDLKRTLAEISYIKNGLEASDFLVDVMNSISSTAQTTVRDGVSLPFINDIVCYGIGSMSKCKIARHQFVLLLKIRELLQVSAEDLYHFDPCHTCSDVKIIKEFGQRVIEINEEGKRNINSRLTLFFMPHCGRPLYDNLLRSNWSPDDLDKLVILGNSFETIFSNSTDKFLSENYPCIHKIHPYLNETPLPNTYQFKDIFNDLSVHRLDGNKLLQYHPDVASFWEIPTEVDYERDKEIIKAAAV